MVHFLNMNLIIIFCATYLIFIAAAYAFYHVITKKERKHHIRHIAIIFGSAVLAWVVAHFMKNAIAHPRPEVLNTLIAPDQNDMFSFPSGHATFMFALAFAMYSFDKHAGKILFVLALLVGIARVLAGVHFWYDILGGFIVAWAVAAAVSYVLKRVIRKS